MVQCEGIPLPGTAIRDREALLRNLVVGDIFHASAPNGASLICLTTAVTETTIEARTATHQMHLAFDRKTGAAEWNAAKEWPGRGHADEWIRCTIDSVAPLPVDIHNMMLFVDRKFRLENDWERGKLTEGERQALSFVHSYYPANLLPGSEGRGPRHEIESLPGDEFLAPFRLPVGP